MNKTLILISATLFGLSSWNLQAAPVDDAPPAQVQKDKVPDSTSNGNFLETQPDENGATSNETSQHKKKGAMPAKDGKPGNIEKSKRMTEPPANGGTNVN